ncbi:dTDP-3-amino-3,6-dideoxy-alpha-D-glucopyranose N,N-dimethyltransferase [Enhygromyxa salina]|uniref:dTDP-3-amino-3,6-dideoxy-alpha-D-glucopyranose N,N-dimethyltransferase n=1 Tax=Enhygromyxa salina TaxID=215803 RepID=A0A2S9XNK7_9BACT|nr:class I SAM-dependent methyltransferase [Enhygromyxa salina]PRP94464.1 dTDP-3-amino-3,6-dideoxy-alpha-D-glucopyranose N,N-dimethyltransferase [Enhygromyxa salina]
MSDEYPARLYAAVHDGNPGDVEFYRRRCAGARSIVELGCGDARVLAALAEPGRSLVGVDLDPGQLALAAARPVAQGEIELVEGDMRTVELGRRFERVIIPHGGLYCLLDEAALAAALARAAALLTDDGLLILDAWAADGFHAEADPDDQDPSWIERVKTVDIDGEAWEVLERSAWDKPRQRIDATYLHVRVGSEDGVEGTLRQRYVLAKQLRRGLSEAGLELVELAGDFDGTAYGAESELMVAIARRGSQA